MDCPQEFALSGEAASLPAIPKSNPNGVATLIGYAADGTSGVGLHGAIIRLQAVVTHDSAWTLSDSVGRFTISELRPGRYQYQVLSVSFQQLRDSIDLRPGVDTLRAALKRGLRLCNVRATEQGAGR
jgi:Carboxypeptidase regulatory-like domain